jgi:DNA-binding transcriptional LysR family regulator
MDLNQGRYELSGLMSEASGSVSIGALSTAVHAFLPQSLALLKRRSKDISVFVREGPLESLLYDLWAGKLDLIVGRLPSDRLTLDLEKRILVEDAVTLVAGPHHPLASRKHLHWSDLKGFSWVMPPVGTVLRGPIELAFQQHGLPMPVNCIETLSVNLRCTYLQESDALAFLGACLSTYYQTLGLIAVLPLELPKLLRPLGVAWDRKRSLSPSIKLMIKCLEEVAHTAKSHRPKFRGGIKKVS